MEKTKNVIKYNYVWRKKGYKPFSKTITKPVPHTMIYNDVVPIKHIRDIVNETGEGWVADNTNDIDSLTVRVNVYYEELKIHILTKRFER